MRIDCGYCGREDGVWSATVDGRLPDTMEAGWQRVACRNKACQAEGDVYLDPECAWCGTTTDLWRTPNRSMDTNTRRWLCRSCLNVTAVSRVVVLQPGVSKPSDESYTPCGSKSLGVSPCGSLWGDPSASRYYMKRVYCDQSGHPANTVDWYESYDGDSGQWIKYPSYQASDHYKELKIKNERRRPVDQAIQR